MLNVEVQSDSQMDTSLFSVATATTEAEHQPAEVSYILTSGVDTSYASSLDTSRVNIHNSILNIEEDDDDDCDELLMHGSFLLPDNENEPEMSFVAEDAPPTPVRQHCCSTELKTRLDVNDNDDDSSLLNQMTEGFVDSLCFHPDGDPDSAATTSPAADLWQGYHSLVETEILEFLSYLKPPTSSELEHIWHCTSPNSKVTPPKRRPARQTLRQRALRVHRLRQMDSPPSSLVKTRSLQHGIQQPILPDELGYDSDPGEVSLPTPQTTLQNCNNGIYHDVQESLNMTWKNLTWHAPANAPVGITAWIERGNLLPSNGVMLEPCLMWRENFLDNKNQLPNTPHSIRLLSLCRIRQAPRRLDRRLYPLARFSHSLLLQTADEHEYLLEAASVAERNQLLERWKHAVARFATLAVMEDVRGIHKEFFLPSPVGNMLVPNYYDEKHYEDDHDDDNYFV